MLTFNDQMFLEQKGISEEKIDMQLNHFHNGFPFMDIERPARPNDGILVLSETEIDEAQKIYDDYRAKGLEAIKFVPASGAATRMFKTLYDALSQMEAGNHDLLSKEAILFFENLKEFPFAAELSQLCNVDLSQPIDIKSKGLTILRKLLFDNGLNYGNLPKGVLKFHKSNHESVTPVEEHLLESALYTSDNDKQARIHFTVSPEHEPLFRKIVREKKEYYEKRFGVTYRIAFSQQKSSTDTIAVTPENKIFRLENGAPVFRPAGHGALIENLSELFGDLVFIKNIDNVVPEHLVADTVRYKKALAGILCKVRQKVFDLLQNLPHIKDQDKLSAIINELEASYHIYVPQSIKTNHEKSVNDLLSHFLNRPIRVCGMVRNEGEPGGGPFWVRDGQGNLSLQVVESSQINLSDPKARAIMQSSTHFNPVDLVCGIKNYKGQKFDLSVFVDPDTGFISEKSLNGKPLRALKLPGLWNGAMAHWLTIFVEVPLSTFNPVKTVNDLLRPQHQ